jgi:Caspase domain
MRNKNVLRYMILLLSFTLVIRLTNFLCMAQQSCNDASSKVALIIGNGKYRSFSPKLNNTINSAQAIAGKLCSLGFKVIYMQDLERSNMEHTLKEFGKALQNSDVGLFYYAGHALQINGRSFLIPIDANIKFLKQVPQQAIDFNLVSENIFQSKMGIIIMDACRNNSLSERNRKIDGLGQIESNPETIVAYATTPRKIALDGRGELTSYTQELVKWIDEPDLEIETFFRRVRITVSRTSKQRQRPWVDSSLTKAFFFNPSKKPNTVSKFWLDYPYPPFKGRRDWQLIDGTLWIERYPGLPLENNPTGFESTFSIVGKTNINGDPGIIVRKIDGDEYITGVPNGTMEIFIPDRGSKLQWVRFRYYSTDESTEWNFLGEMQDID